MRIHDLQIEAFGPFADAVRIDLDQLSDAGLFLLTGATGAGKTSVLDAICFALYGAVPGDRQIAKRLRSDQAAPGVAPSVTMEFSVTGRRFRIERSPAWQRAKKRGTGQTTEQPRVLVSERVAGVWTPLASRLDEAGHLVSGLLGMTLTQFCQVQLLPQGRFQAFLRADSDERHQLLQQLFRTSRFEDVETWLRERRRSLRRESTRHHEKVADLVSRISEASGEPLPHDYDLHALDPVVDTLTGWADRLLADATAWDDSARDTADRAARAEAAARTRLADAQVTDERRQRLARARAEEAALASSAADHHEHQSRLDAGRRAAAVLPAAEAAIVAATELTAATDEADGALATAGSLLGLPELPVDQLVDRQRSATEAAARARAHAPRVDERDRITAVVDLGEARLAELTASLEQTNRRLEALPDTVALRRTTEAEAARAVEELESARRECTAVRERRDAARLAVQLEGQHREADALRQTSVDAAQLATHHWLELHELRLTGMAAEIAGAMAVGACCPVCGSAEHPHRAEPAPGAPSAADVRAARRLVDDAEVVRQARTGALHDLSVRIAHARERAGQQAVPILEAELSRAETRVEQLAARAATLPEAVQAREASERDLADLTARRSVLETDRAALAATLDEQRERLADLTQQLAAVLAGSGHASIADLAHHLDAVAEACGQAATAAAECARRRDAAESARGRASAAAVKHGFGSLAEALVASLTPEALTVLDREVRAREARQAAVASVLADPDLLAVADTEQPDLPTLAAAHAEAEQASADARDAAAEGRRRHERLRRLRTELAAGLARWTPIRADHAQTDRLATLADGTSPDNRLRMRLSGYVLAFRLRQVVAAANERLVTMTDRRYRLEHSGDRGAGESRGGLSLRIRDDWSGESRDPVTLSGGETFVVSLALALGLADVIAHEAGGSELDTLFVDEGFGTLDADTLDDVMDTLDSLRDGGRVVGVVSHVAELRDRIPTQLHVRKQRAGSTVHPQAVG